MMHVLSFFPILKQHLQIVFCLMRRTEINGCIFSVLLLVEDKGPEL